MKYQSEILKEIIDSEGHITSLLHYESECVESWIEEARPSYPKLCDYQSEWLNYINNHEPIGEFPYVSLMDVTEATVNNVVPYAYKSATLKGSTKYRDIDTGEVLDAFEDGRNLELVSVKTPVLMTTGKNLYNGYEKGSLNTGTGLVDTTKPNECSVNFIYIRGQKRLKTNLPARCIVLFYDINKEFVDTGWHEYTSSYPTINIPSGYDLHYMRIRIRPGEITEQFKEKDVMVVRENDDIVPYEPYKSNILTVNEDVTLRSNGDVCDELDLLTGKLTQRIDEDGEVLVQEVVKTVDLNITNQDGEKLNRLRPIEGTMHLSTDGNPIKPTFTGEVPIEAITQNLASFIEE